MFFIFIFDCAAALILEASFFVSGVSSGGGSLVVLEEADSTSSGFFSGSDVHDIFCSPFLSNSSLLAGGDAEVGHDNPCGVN